MKLIEIAVQYNKTLNPKLWKDNQLVPEVRAQFIKIANKFVEFLAIDTKYIKDLVVTGSNCNYNWTASSDIDLHVVVDYKQFQQGCDAVDTEELFNNKKALWNDTHDITIYDIPVELYVQDGLKSGSRDGVMFSIIQDKWILPPTRYEKLDIDEEKVDKLYKSLKTDIEKFVKNKDKTKIDKFQKAMADARKRALAKDGEFSIFNLAYKKLRKDKILNKLWDASVDLNDEDLSLE